MRSRPGRPARVYLQTLGCPKNEADSRHLERKLLRSGVQVAQDPEASTHVLLNTCGFIEPAKEESVNAILDACAHYPDKTVLVMGCLVERYRAELQEGIPEVAGWFGLAGERVEAELVSVLGGRPGSVETGVDSDGGETRGSYAYLKISDGCDEMCSFCAIPAIKGPYGSVALAEILREADACLADGARELVLVGQDTSRWTGDGLDLLGLVEVLARDARVHWIRVMYLQPDGVSDTFLQRMAQTPKLCRYLDIPFQHSYPDLLRAMGRRGDGASYLDLIERARRWMPDVSVRSAFIVAFPGESEGRFDHLMDFVEKARFDNGGGFVYSPEEGTTAAGLRPRVSRAKAQARLNRLTAAMVEGAEQAHQGMIGSVQEVMIDESGPDGEYEGCVAVGRMRGQAPEVDGMTYIEGRLPTGTVVGDIVEVMVTAAAGYDLVGRCDAS